MKTALRVILIALCVATCLVLTACGSLTYSVAIGSGGARTLTITVAFDDTVDDTARAQAKDFLTRVRDVRNTNGRQCELVEGDGYVSLKEEFESATDYYIAMGITGDEEGEDVPYVDLDAYFLEYEIVMNLVERSTVLNYALQYVVSVDASVPFLWKYNCEGRSAIVVDNPLQSVYQSIAESTDPIGVTLQALDGEQGDLLCDELEQWLADKGYSLADVPFRYTYEHVYKSVYAKDYTRCYQNSVTGCTVYEWDMTLAEVADADFTLYQRVPRVWAWELTAVAVGLATMGVILLIILIKRRRINNAANKAGEQ